MSTVRDCTSDQIYRFDKRAFAARSKPADTVYDLKIIWRVHLAVPQCCSCEPTGPLDSALGVIRSPQLVKLINCDAGVTVNTAECESVYPRCGEESPECVCHST